MSAKGVGGVGELTVGPKRTAALVRASKAAGVAERREGASSVTFV